MNRKLGQPQSNKSRLAWDMERHPNLKYCELSEEQLRKKLNEIHRYLMRPESMLLGYVYQRMFSKDMEEKDDNKRNSDTQQ